MPGEAVKGKQAPSPRAGAAALAEGEVGAAQREEGCGARRAIDRSAGGCGSMGMEVSEGIVWVGIVLQCVDI